MDEFSYGLRLLLIKFVDEQTRINSIMEGCQEQLIVHLVYRQGFFVKTSHKGPQAFIFPLLYG